MTTVEKSQDPDNRMLKKSVIGHVDMGAQASRLHADGTSAFPCHADFPCQGLFEHPVNVNLQRALIVLAAIGTLLILGRLLKYSAYGIDFTDESFYLVWMSNPFIYDGSLSQFGFVYHPLYKLVSGNIANLRQANFLITFALAWCLVYVFLTSLTPQSRANQLVLHTASAGFATSAFMVFVIFNWLPTPSYNSLTLQALLITGIGLLLAEKTATRKSIAGWVIIGIGGWLAFMAKPSTAAALAVGVLIYLAFSRKLSVRLLLLAVASAILLLLVSALLIDGSVSRFVERIQLGAELAELLGGGYTLRGILRVDDFQLGGRLKLAISFVLITCFIATWGIWSEKRKRLIVGILFSSALFACAVLLTFGETGQTVNLGQFQGLLIFAVVFAAILTGLIFGRINALKSITASQWAIAGLFLVMPHIYAFGANNHYWRQGSAAAIFWVLAGLTMLVPLVRERGSWLFALPLALATQTVTALILHEGCEQPYRQPQPLRLNTSFLDFGRQGSTLVLSEGYAEYISGAIATAQKAGYGQNTPVIDLSGQSPGILYALRAENIGQVWTLGGYPGSLKLAKASLDLTPCDKIAAAWVLYEPDGPRSIPTELMPMLGAAFPDDYQLIGSWQTAEGAGGFKTSRTQEFYKPIASANTLNACKALREKGVQ